jgi:hypothetical protein
VVKLISTLAAIVLATSTLANAAPRQTAKGKTGKATVSKSAKRPKPANRPVAKASTVQRTAPAPVQRTGVPAVQRTSALREPLTARPTTAYAAAPAAKAPVVREHNVKAEELEIKRLKGSVKAAEKAGDWRGAARDRRAMYQLEADVRSDKADAQDQLKATRNSKKKSRIPFWGWWR